MIEFILVLTYHGGWQEAITGYTSRQQAEMHAVRMMKLQPEIVGYEVRQVQSSSVPACS